MTANAFRTAPVPTAVRFPKMFFAASIESYLRWRCLSGADINIEAENAQYQEIPDSSIRGFLMPPTGGDGITHGLDAPA